MIQKYNKWNFVFRRDFVFRRVYYSKNAIYQLDVKTLSHTQLPRHTIFDLYIGKVNDSRYFYVHNNYILLSLL